MRSEGCKPKIPGKPDCRAAQLYPKGAANLGPEIGVAARGDLGAVNYGSYATAYGLRLTDQITRRQVGLAALSLGDLLLQELEHGDLFTPECGAGTGFPLGGRLRWCGRCNAALVGIQDRGMHIVLPAHSARVAEPGRHLLERAIDVALDLALAHAQPHLPQGPRRQHRAAPRAKVLGGHIEPRHLAQVRVDVVRIYALPLPSSSMN